MIRQLMWLFFLVAAAATQAHAEQGCPYASSVKFVDGHFQVSIDGKTRWQSPKADYGDFADRFVGALFTPGKDAERENGFLDRCVYRTGSGHLMILRYYMTGAFSTMSLTSSLHWELAADPLSQSVYICRDSQPDNCSFTVGRLD